MTSIPISAADRATVVAAIDAASYSLSTCYDELPDHAKAAVERLAHELSALRKNLDRPTTVRREAMAFVWRPRGR